VAHEVKDADPLATLTLDFDLCPDLFGTLEDFEHCSYVLVITFALEMAILAGFSALKLDGI
jgi:hypothetical protein